MKAGKYSIKDLFSNRHIEQIIIPEIQRDYVWGKEHVIGLLKSIKLDFERFKSESISLSVSDDESIRDVLVDFYKKQKFSSNIGFIYAYNDAEYPGKYFLIDGQQRITTIYLMLLALASKNEQTKASFEKTYLDRGRLKVDYKVREASHDFLNKFFKFILIGGVDVSNESWYYDEYFEDKTILSIIRNFRAINEILEEEVLADFEFYNYLQDYVEFWYFDTNISEQGEELYIYMNARGEQMQGNENLKADLLGKLEKNDIQNLSKRIDNCEAENVIGLKKYWGKKWEEWQDIFWDNRGHNENSDNGFNEFLSCICGLENYLNNIPNYYTNIEYENNEENKGKGREMDIKYSDILSSLSSKGLEKIETYISCLVFLKKEQKKFSLNYSYSRWLKNCLDQFWDIINTKKTNWFANYNDNNRSTERKRMVFIWSIFYYFKEKSADETLDSIELYRVLRFFYVRYNNNNRSVKTLKDTIDLILINGILESEDMGNKFSVVVNNPQEETDKEFRTAEEKAIYGFLKKKTHDIEKFESLIWEIEDHHLNLNGTDVGAINITHLISLKDDLRIDDLEKVKTRFFNLFPNNVENGSDLLKITLLYYGEFWKNTSLSYYDRYDFSNWRSIIRGPEFTEMFNKIKESTLEEHYLFLQNQFLANNAEVIIQAENLLPDVDLRNKLIYYSILLGDEDMWTEGDKIAVRYLCETPRLFENETYKIFNSKGTFRSDWGNSDLWEKVKEKYDSPLQELKNKLNDVPRIL